jgi:hypothetical protein
MAEAEESFYAGATEEVRKEHARSQVQQLVEIVESGECKFFCCVALKEGGFKVIGVMTEQPPWPERMEEALKQLWRDSQRMLMKARAIGEGKELG